MKHGIANESVALTGHVSLLTTQSVTVNLVPFTVNFLFLEHHLTLSLQI